MPRKNIKIKIIKIKRMIKVVNVDHNKEHVPEEIILQDDKHFDNHNLDEVN